MQSPRTHQNTRTGILVFAIGLLFIFLPIIVVIILDHSPFPGAIVGPSEVAPVLGLIFCIIASMMIIQDNFGY